MKFYIASKLENYEQVQYIRDRLKEQGWTHTYDWTQHGSVKSISTELLKEVAEKEFQGVKEADVVIVLTPQGRGTHVELGMALALDKKVFIWHENDKYFKCTDDTSSFYWLPNVHRLFGTIDGLIKILTAK
ncbi:nucleoside 2-deoxyribosyltransferase [Clostridium estertheticum]|uniref:nucleoside 2-deoxyribosyltransferase n=1 Tax=Clostridium estertheticum TaxID=238834 RepID=UPI0013E9484A|nr:nucleoside 2-deoxyribosyltransferase [Clostridium estertheticum]MBZ9688516.1 nucleoside 2-deoxyribosyltransferase [Clostridium estertheticum]